LKVGRETRVLRPFDIPASLEHFFDGATLRFGAQRIRTDEGLRVWGDPDTYGSQEVELELSEEDTFDGFRTHVAEGAEKGGFALVDLSLLVFVTSGYLGTTEVVYRQSLDDGTPSHRTLNLASGASRAAGLRVVSHRPNRITAYLVLNRKIPERPLRPWRKGTWLAHCEFRIGLEAPSALFRPLPLDDKKRRDFRLPPGTVRYLRSCDPRSRFDPETPPEMYVDAEILQTISRDAKSAVSQMFQRELAACFIRSVVAEAMRETDEWRNSSWDQLEDSLLGRIVKYVEGKGRSKEDYTRRLDDLRSDPERQIAIAEDRLKVRAAILKAVHPVTSQ